MLGAAVLVLLLQAPAYPPTSGDFTPDWRRRPSLEEVARVYPAPALAARQGGLARLACVADAAGLLRDCYVAGEDPAGYGFGEAALRLQSIYAMRPMLPDGRSVTGGRLRIPIQFPYAELERLGFLKRD